MPKWPLLVLMLVACSGENELEAPMLGDCPHCGRAPLSSGSSSGGDGGLDASSDAADAFDFDASTLPDELATVDVGVPSDLDAFLNP